MSCPKCGTELESGYGLAGGGIGPYMYCPSFKCNYLLKTTDTETTAMAPKPYEGVEDVKKALLDETIDADEAKVILVDTFEYSEDEAATAVDGWEELVADADDDDDETDEPA